MGYLISFYKEFTAIALYRQCCCSIRKSTMLSKTEINIHLVKPFGKINK